MATARRRGTGTATAPRDEEETVATPRRGRASAPTADADASADEESPAPRRRRSARPSATDEDSTPSRRASGRGGWDSFKKNKDIGKGGGDYIPKESIFRPTETPTLVKFVDDEPFVAYAQHWLKSVQGRKGWECIVPLPYDGDEDTGLYGERGECPLCDQLDDNPRAKSYFNVVIFDEDAEEWVYRVLEAGVMLGDQLQALAEGNRGPLSKNYWELSATGGGNAGKYSPNCVPVKPRDLPEDWDLEPLTEEEIADLTKDAYDATIITFPPLSKLQELVDTVLG